MRKPDNTVPQHLRGVSQKDEETTMTEPEYVTLAPFEVEVTITGLLGDNPKEIHVRVSSPTQKHTKELFEMAVTDALRLRSSSN